MFAVWELPKEMNRLIILAILGVIAVSIFIVFFVETNIEVGVKPVFQSCEELWSELNQLLNELESSPTTPTDERMKEQEKYFEIYRAFYAKCTEWMMEK